MFDNSIISNECLFVNHEIENSQSIYGTAEFPTMTMFIFWEIFATEAGENRNGIYKNYQVISILLSAITTGIC